MPGERVEEVVAQAVRIDEVRAVRRHHRVGGPAVSVYGFITGRDPGPGRGLGEGSTLFDWYFDGDVPSAFGSFHLPEHVRLRLVETVPAPGVTHLRYEVLGAGQETS